MTEIEQLQSLGFKPHASPGGNHDHSLTGQWVLGDIVGNLIVECDIRGDWWGQFQGNGRFVATSLGALLRKMASGLPAYRRLNIHIRRLQDSDLDPNAPPILRALGGDDPTHSGWYEDEDAAVADLLQELRPAVETSLRRAQADLEDLELLDRIFKAP